jgi:hypothetical protein
MNGVEKPAFSDGDCDPSSSDSPILLQVTKIRRPGSQFLLD